MWDPRRLLHMTNRPGAFSFQKKKGKKDQRASETFLSVLFLLKHDWIFVSQFLCSISFGSTLAEHSGNDAASGKEEKAIMLHAADCWSVPWK